MWRWSSSPICTCARTGWCWYPANVSADWRPYSNGYWLWSDGGWTWVSEEPWAWASYHYGRWVWHDYHGWLWVPGIEWAPAWVSWQQHDGYVGWAPLDYWNRPAYIRTVYYDHYGPHSWTFVTYHHFGHGHHGKNGRRGYRDRYGV